MCMTGLWPARGEGIHRCWRRGIIHSGHSRRWLPWIPCHCPVNHSRSSILSAMQFWLLMLLLLYSHPTISTGFDFCSVRQLSTEPFTSDQSVWLHRVCINYIKWWFYHNKYTSRTTWIIYQEMTTFSVIIFLTDDWKSSRLSTSED